jgi:hypothetical protein
MQLLKKTIGSYFIFSVILLLAAIPVFYYALKTVMVQNVDENLIATKTRIIPQLKDAVAGHDHGQFNFPVNYPTSCHRGGRLLPIYL